MTTGASATVSALPMRRGDYDREAFARATEWTAAAAEVDHRMTMRLAVRVGGKQRLTPDETVRMIERHVAANPACQPCRDLLATAAAS